MAMLNNQMIYWLYWGWVVFFLFKTHQHYSHLESLGLSEHFRKGAIPNGAKMRSSKSTKFWDHLGWKTFQNVTWTWLNTVELTVELTVPSFHDFLGWTVAILLDSARWKKHHRIPFLAVSKYSMDGTHKKPACFWDDPLNADTLYIFLLRPPISTQFHAPFVDFRGLCFRALHPWWYKGSVD